MVLFAGFDGSDNPARAVVKAVSAPCRRVILPNDKERSAELLNGEIARYKPDIVLMTGQKPVICDKLSVEMNAKASGGTLTTALDCAAVRDFVLSCGYGCYISENCGTSYCNHIYAECLKSFPRGLFIHIPYGKNISDMNELVRIFDRLILFLGESNTSPAQQRDA